MAYASGMDKPDIAVGQPLDDLLEALAEGEADAAAGRGSPLAEARAPWAEQQAALKAKQECRHA
jgi:ABC-type amino acid transport substrate-binding protein